MGYTPNYDLNGNFLSVQNGGSVIPVDVNNIDYQAFQAWLNTQGQTQAQWLIANPWTPWGALTLAQYQAQQIAALKTACDALADSRYPQTNQTAMVVMLMQATQQGLTNRAAYLEQVWTWATAITMMYYQKAALVQACTSQAQVQAVTWSAELTALATQDPDITIQAAMAITN